MRIPSSEAFGIYNDTFIYLESKFGKDSVLDFWNYISENYKTLEEYLTKYGGLEGAFRFWDTAFQEEGLEYEIKKGEDFLEIVVHDCLPHAWKRKHGIKSYEAYCEHCDAIYSPVLKRHGLKADIVWDIGGIHGECKRRITRINKYGN